ncbi:hypothetical protein [Ponticoccus alexandrii]|uniref:Large ATP-binding protein n=1 Tax=Ponticoccus alexandrii TaxID=1943633 RepID=A0ABX7FD71_9RHOB|nr:hypothetical protein [Ponticoccus alexandrii]ETA51220.2 hypothetical protein P279_15255 [Rhodobacteraceae bacterium PD-2]QRF67801.1 hypothetical protein GQA70_16720 [Ponticoccus alexandrii]
MSGSWLEAVAEKAGLRPAEAELALRKRGIVANRPLRPARTLTIRRIAFKGEKRGTAHGSIDFDWSELTAGVWAVTSQRNLRGKSSVLEILLWALRGSPKGLQDDVRRWLSWVCVEFDVDDQRYIVEFAVEERVPRGTLARRRLSGELDGLDRFMSNDGFEAAMSRFMMNTLDLDPITAMQGKEDQRQIVEHGWAALSGGLYFGGDHKQLLGDVQMAGLPARMLQMYIGLPWATTVMQAGTAKRELEQEIEKASRSAKAAAADAEKARERIDRELQTARKLLDSFSQETGTAAELERLAGEVARLSPIALELERRLVRTETEATELERLAAKDERAVRDLRENIVATQFFNGLQPVCCPRCETRVSKERLNRESADLSCSLCAEEIPIDEMEGESDGLEAIEQQFAAAKAAADRARAAVKSLVDRSKVSSGELDKARQELSKAATSATFEDRRKAELDVARLEGALKEHQRPVTPEISSPDLTLASAAHAEADKAYQAGRGDILERLNTEILSLGQRLGVQMLEGVKLNTNASLLLTKGGESTSFGKVTAGERLRIATAVALLRVGQERGLGRHPGLLIIDSPAAEEVSPDDLTAVLSELQAISHETAGLQIIIGSANAGAIVEQLGEQWCRAAIGDNYLW